MGLRFGQLGLESVGIRWPRGVAICGNLKPAECYRSSVQAGAEVSMDPKFKEKAHGLVTCISKFMAR